MLGGFNADVLEAKPETAEAKARLVDELRNRAKGCVSSRNFPEAVRLYSKALKVLPTDDKAARSVIYANRSMCNVQMNELNKALKDADDALQADESYLKAYYRKATALHALERFSAAKETILTGLDKKPDDKDMKALLVKIEEGIKRGPKAAKTAAPSSSTPLPDSVFRASSAAATTTSPPVASKAATTAKTSVSGDGDDEEDEDLRSLNVRGYKKTADGRVTTFFNNELDENTKQLIGNIAPKKIDAPASAAITPASSNGIGSAWNTAGTYEERVVTDWAVERLKAITAVAHLAVSKPFTVSSDAALVGRAFSVALKISKIESCSGHAQVTMSRGKKKHMSDLSLEAKWSLSLTSSAPSSATLTLEGSVSLFDVTADEEYESSCTISDTSADNLVAFAGTLGCGEAAIRLLRTQAYNTFVRSQSGGAGADHLHGLLGLCVREFCREIKAL